MRLYEVIWKNPFVRKIESKHHVKIEEGEEILFSGSHFRRAQKGRVKGENLYVAYRRTETGRYLVVFFIRKRRTAAMPISARDMTASERRYYDEKK